MDFKGEKTMLSKAMLSKRACFVLLSVLGVSVMSGCRSNKSTYSFAPPQPPTTSYASSSYASSEPPSNAVPDSLPVMAPPTTAADAYSTPADSSYIPSDYSPTPSKSSSGCASGCCSR